MVFGLCYDVGTLRLELESTIPMFECGFLKENGPKVVLAKTISLANGFKNAYSLI